MSLATPNQIRTLPRKLYRKAKEEPDCGCPVSLAVNPVGEPDAGNPHVRFDERGWETGRRVRRHRAHPRLY
ncbi:MAG TPA: hypothetical protein VJY15_10150 [Candidatus Acidoferrum sp.]|nr:hypothetical protein [Candidatus Acidoferrum sp.]